MSATRGDLEPPMPYDLTKTNAMCVVCRDPQNPMSWEIEMQAKACEKAESDTFNCNHNAGRCQGEAKKMYSGADARDDEVDKPWVEAKEGDTEEGGDV